jgi:hypothetical protein
MNLICKLIGHKWFETSQYYEEPDKDPRKPSKQMWLKRYDCMRCGAVDEKWREPYVKGVTKR